MTPPKKIYGLIGYPVKHSFSPLMHNLWFRRLKERGVIDYDAEYKLFEVKPEELEDFLLNRKDVIGFNITLPHKVRAKEILAEKSPVPKNRILRVTDHANITGAVNTVKREENNLIYANTDLLGFIRSLENDLRFERKHKKVLIIGCGGGGRAVVLGVNLKPEDVTNIYIYDSNGEAVNSAQECLSKFPYLNGKFEFISQEQIPEFIKECDLLVNATPVGMNEGDGSPIDKNLLHGDLFVYDFVYNRNTQLVKDAKERCKSAVGGLGMLLYQGKEAFELWTGKNLRKEEIEEAKSTLEKALGQK